MDTSNDFDGTQFLLDEQEARLRANYPGYDQPDVKNVKKKKVLKKSLKPKATRKKITPKRECVSPLTVEEEKNIRKVQWSAILKNRSNWFYQSRTPDKTLGTEQSDLDLFAFLADASEDLISTADDVKPSAQLTAPDEKNPSDHLRAYLMKNTVNFEAGCSHHLKKFTQKKITAYFSKVKKINRLKYFTKQEFCEKYFEGDLEEMNSLFDEL